MSTVFVATVETRYEVVAVGETEDQARPAELALKYLDKTVGLDDDTDTVEKVADYFGINVTKVNVGTACFQNNER
jgi:hypothetical protein